MVHMKNVGRRLNFAREKRKYSQEYLAELVGISPVHLSRIENGHVVPKADILAELSKNLDFSADFLLFGERRGENLLTELFMNRVKEREERELQLIIGIVEQMVGYFEG